MLIGFRVENWKSFKNPISFSMVKTPERQHGERIPRIGKDRMGILPVAAIYGGNASGKTNLFSALYFMKEFVSQQRGRNESTGAKPFLLSDATRTGLTKFTARVLAKDDVVYELSFSLDAKHVEDETLLRVDGGRDQVLYHRVAGNKNPRVSPLLGSNKKRLEGIFEGTQDNQLFLSDTVFRKCDAFQQVFDWFSEDLQLISPTATYSAFQEYIANTKMAEILGRLDTGVVDIGGSDVALSDLHLPSEIVDRLPKDLGAEGSTATLENDSGLRYVVSNGPGGGLSVKELVTHHQKDDNSTMDFHMSQESDGTQRLMDLLPAFLSVANPASRRVYVVDELDRSLHTLLTRSLLESYLGCCSANSRAQFIFTTHDALLMDQHLLRRDEIWVTERRKDGSSALFSFSEFKDARKDNDIRKSYLQGRLGGVPRIFLDDVLGCSVFQGQGEPKDGKK